MIVGGKDSFLFGAYSPNGWWYYFPVAFAAKTPLPTLILIGASLVFVYRRGTWRSTLPLLIPVVIYFALGERAGPILDRLKRWMAHNNGVIMAVLLLVIGLKLLGDGIASLGS